MVSVNAKRVAAFGVEFAMVYKTLNVSSVYIYRHPEVSYKQSSEVKSATVTK